MKVKFWVWAVKGNDGTYMAGVANSLNDYVRFSARNEDGVLEAQSVPAYELRRHCELHRLDCVLYAQELTVAEGEAAK